MKKTLLITLILSLISCNPNKYEKKLIGDWYEHDGNIKFDFDKDSVTIFDFQIQKTIWTADDKKIKINYKVWSSDSIIKTPLNYKLINENTLIIKTDIDSSKTFKFIKAKDYLDFLSIKHKVNFQLEQNEKAIIQRKSNFHGIKVFIGFHQNKVVAKTEFSENLKNLDNDIVNKTRQIKSEYENNYKDVFEYEKWKELVLHYSIFVDKRVHKDTLDFYLNKLRASKIKKIYRVYNTKEEELTPFHNLKEIKL